VATTSGSPFFPLYSLQCLVTDLELTIYGNNHIIVLVLLKYTVFNKKEAKELRQSYTAFAQIEFSFQW